MIAPSENIPSPRRRAASDPVRDGAGLWADIPAFTAFAQEVQESLFDTELPYKQRSRLMKRAAHYGIRKFDANLIIAMVQNRAGANFNPGRNVERSPWLAYAAIALAIQAAIVLFGWIILHPSR